MEELKNILLSQQLDYFFTEIPFELSYYFCSANFDKPTEKTKSYRLITQSLINLYCQKLQIKNFKYSHYENGAPNFNNQFIGSISHSEQLVSVIATSDTQIKSIGIDIEFNFNKCLKVIDRITCTNEFKDIVSYQLSDSEKAASIFSIKEAFYKAFCANGKNIPGLSWNSLSIEKIINDNIQATYFPSEYKNITSIYKFSIYSKIIYDVTEKPFVFSVVICT
jgi:phosphopantetheinyl transferase (holo-ACP synthase)